jgi:FkbM family methyltransferase
MIPFRRIAERLARGLVVRRRLPAGFGPGRVLVSPDSMLRVMSPDLAAADPLLFAFARRFVTPGMAVWDIGANLGLFGFAAAWMAGPAGRVLLVEPDPWLCGLLQRSARGLAGRGYAPTLPACCAVVGEAGPVELHIAARGRASNAVGAFGRSQMGGVRDRLVTGGVTLDQLLAASFPPGLVKIDIEGAEVEALRGAAALLRTRPVILAEVGREGAEEATAILRAAGYRLHDSSLRPVDRCVWATVALPA